MGNAILCGQGGYAEATHYCEQADNFFVMGGVLSANLSWTTPGQDEDSSFVGVRIVRKEGSKPTSIWDGTVVYEGTALACVDSNLTIGKTYYYRIFAYDSAKNFQTSPRSVHITADTGSYITSLPVGSLININVDGSPKVFIVVHQYITSDLYGGYTWGTWLLMKDIYTQQKWGSSNSYGDSTIHTYLNSTFFNLLDKSVQDRICTPTLPYRSGSGTSKTVTGGSDGLKASVFLLSAVECGAGGSSYVPQDGVKLDYFNTGTAADSTRIAYLNGTATAWTTRSPYTSRSTYVARFSTTGALGSSTYSTSTLGIRPAMILDAYTKVALGNDGIYNIVSDSDIISDTDIPSYVSSAAISLAKEVNAAQQKDSITFIAAADAHQLDADENIVTGNKHAGMAMRILRRLVPNIDFCCFLGDYTVDTGTTTLAEGRQHFDEVNSYLEDGFADLPQFRTPGERDGLKSSWLHNDGSLESEEIYSYVGKYNESASYVSASEGYCYRDFDEKKLRVFCLNTSVGGQNFDTMGSPQLLWFARKLREVGARTGWGVVILSHYPLDFTDSELSDAASTVGSLLYQYVTGGSFKVGGMTVSYKNCNKAKIYATFHGHTHNFKTAKLNYVQDSGNTEFDVLRVATPNMCYSYNNEFGQNDGVDSNGIEFGETTTYNKTSGKAKDTSFVVNVINPSEGKIHSFCYGAGYDREITIV